MAKTLGTTERERRFNRASRYYWGRQYEDLEPWTTPDKPLREKRPSVQVGLTRKAVNRINAHLFGEGHKPTFGIEGRDDLEGDALDKQNKELDRLLSESGLKRRYSEIGRLGVLHGTVAVGFYVFDGGRLDTDIVAVAKSKPVFGRDDRARAIELGLDFDELLELEEYWRSMEEDEFGEETEYWHRRDWTTVETIEYEPIQGPIDSPEDLKWRRDDESSVRHDLGFVPVEWITPIEVAHDNDGAPIVDEPEFLLEDEINYTLSQTGRGIRYNQEPTLVFTGVDAKSEDAIKRGANNTLRVQTDPGREGGQPADAKLLEMSGSGSMTSMEYVRLVRNMFNEIVQVVDHDPVQFAGALSGVALERLLYPMVMLVQNLRPEFDEKLGRLILKMLKATKRVEVGEDTRVTAAWPPVVDSTAVDLRDYVSAIVELYSLDLIGRKKVIEFLSPFLDIDDVDAYLKELTEGIAEQGTTQTGGALDPQDPTPAPGSNFPVLPGVNQR